MHARPRRLGVVATGAGATARGLVQACTRFGIDAAVLSPEQALAVLGPEDVALGRLDVRQTLDGVERGLWELRVLDRESVRVLNPASNGAVDFTRQYRRERDVFEAAVEGLLDPAVAALRAG